MSTTRRTGWSLLKGWGLGARSARRAEKGVPVRGRAARLAELAGQSVGASGIESLEARQLLFALQVSPGDVNPATGLGTVTATFGYVIPYTVSPVITVVQPTLVTEDFNDETAFWTTFNPPIPPSGTFLQTSDFQVTYTGGAVVALNPPVAQQGSPRSLRVQLQGNDTTSFQFFTAADQTGARNLRVATRLTFVGGPLGDGDGINSSASGTRLQLLRGGQVVANISGAALAALATPAGGGAFNYNLNFSAGFDQIRFRSAQDAPDNNAYSDQFFLDDLVATFPGGTYAAFVESRIFGATVSLTGPAGATANFLDLYGAPITRTLALGIPPGSQVPIVDPNDDGIPDFNEGIGQILLSGTDQRSSLTILGGTVDALNGGFVFALSDSVEGLLNDFEGSGFGYTITTETTARATGLPGSGASLIIGSPVVRDRSTQNGYQTDAFAGGFLTPASFNRADQGIFLDDGGTIGSVNVHAVLYGQSRFTGAVGRLAIGSLLGSVRVEGDLGTLHIAAEAGVWSADDILRSFTSIDNVNLTQSQIIVGRTVREIAIAGRNYANVSVLADTNNPNRRSLQQVDFYEREATYRIVANAANPIQLTLASLFNANQDPFGIRGGLFGEAAFFGDGFFRNDDLTSAEFVGYNGTSVRINGSITGGDPINTQTDRTDVFAFAADPTREVVIQYAAGSPFLRIFDRNGRPIVGDDPGGYGRGTGGNFGGGTSRVLRFRPESADVYYLVLSVPQDTVTSYVPYSVTLSGLAPVTFGQFRTGAGSGVTIVPVLDPLVNNRTYAVNLSSGSLGSIRIGTGFFSSSGGATIPTSVINSRFTTTELLIAGRATYNVAGNLYNFLAGGDIDGAQIIVGRNLGSLRTGEVTGRGPTEGDLYQAEIRVGRDIGVLDISGAVGIYQTSAVIFRTGGAVSIRSGTSGGGGNVGQFLVGNWVWTSQLTFQIPSGAQVDQLLVGPGTGPFAGEIRGGTPDFGSGNGSDFRFVDFTAVQRGGVVDATTDITPGQPATFTDDAGGSVQIAIVGGTPAGSQISVRTIGINFSRGVVIARITGTLAGGASLVISGIDPGVVSIGRIILTIADSSAGVSDIQFTGGTQIDVGRLDITGAVRDITNSTPGGDIVAIDAQSIRGAVTITRGNLGRTQTSGAGASLLGPDLGLTAQRGSQQLGSGLGVSQASINISNPAKWDGNTFFLGVTVPTPVTDPGPLEDNGSPIDGRLDGLVVRAGDLRNVSVSGSIGDVIVEGGELLLVTANSDGVTPFGGFDGIVGSIYAVSIDTVDVGDGLAGTGASAFAAAGIFSDDDILLVRSTRIRGAVIRGVIIAANSDRSFRTNSGTENPVAIPGGFAGGIRRVQLVNAGTDDAIIAGESLDGFWNGERRQDQGFFTGSVETIDINGGNLFRTFIQGIQTNSITITGGAWDASFAEFTSNAGPIFADEFRNSTRIGPPSEFRTSRIRVVGDFSTIQTNGLNGDISDTTFDANGRLTGTISARTFDRVSFRINNAINNITATQDFRASSIVAGVLRVLDVRDSVRTTTISIAGPIRQILVGNEITATEITSTGPDGRVDLLRAQNRIQVTVSSDGPIGTVESVLNDVEASITTTDAADGSLALVRAGDELLLDLEIRGDVGTLQSARNIGRRTDPKDRSLDIRGNLGSIIAGGQIYSDVLVGQQITGSITNARVSSKPGADLVSRADIIAFGRINTLNLNGDFNGNIISYSGGIGTVTFNLGTLRQGRKVQTLDGSIDQITFIGGDLLGSIISDGSIGRIDLVRDSTGYVSQIGVASGKSNAVSVDSIRNQLPPGTQITSGIDGATILARFDIGTINLAAGAIWESTIWAGQTIGAIIAPSIRNDRLTTVPGSGIGAGDRVALVQVGGVVSRLQVVAGVTNLGADNRLGGTGTNADTLKSGTIGTIGFGNTNNTTFSAGITAGANGRYNQADSRRAPGVSGINTINVVNRGNVSAFSDGAIRFASPGVTRTPAGIGQFEAGRVAGFAAGDTRIFSGTPLAFTTTSGERGTVTYNGPGLAFWNGSLNRVRVRGANANASLVVSAAQGVLTDFVIVGGNNVRFGTITVNATLQGNSRAYIDGTVNAYNLSRVDTDSGLFGSGEGVQAFQSGAFVGGTLLGRLISNLTINGNFGRADRTDEAFVSVIAAGNVTINGTLSAAISADRTIQNFTAGSIVRGGVRAGYGIDRTTVNGPTDLARITGRDFLNEVTINGSTNETVIAAGPDLGTDANFGGSGSAADRVTNGVIGEVNVTGDFIRSDIAAGVIRGPSGFIGGDDPIAADGRSQIGVVTIGGSQTGSSLFTQQFRVISTGTVESVSVAGRNFESAGNFSVRELAAAPVPVLVSRLEVSQESLIYSARIIFDAPINAATLSAALSVSELRNGGSTTFGLAEGSDYTLRYEAISNTAIITFARSVTSRSLPQTPGVPGPGVYQFRLSAAILRGESQLSLLDGNADGLAGDDFFGNAVVGDAGDKITSGNPSLDPTINFYGASDLDLVLNRNNSPSNVPAINSLFTVRGYLGDHPNSNATTFRAGGDVDVYKITLRAGQILRLSELRGAAFQAVRSIYDSAGNQIASTDPTFGATGGRPGSAIVRLPSTLASSQNDAVATAEDQYLVARTGVYYLVLGTDASSVPDITDIDDVQNSSPTSASLGLYSFDLTVFDDSNSGFLGDTSSGIGASVVNAPSPIVFAGSDGRFDTADDLNVFVTGDFRFTLDRGPDGRPNTRDDTVRGNNGVGGIVSTRTAGADNRFGTADDVLTSTVSSAIGLPSSVGAPFQISPDVDVFRLNAGQPIAPGTRVRATVRLTETGSNFGLAEEQQNSDVSLNFFSRDLSGSVQFALFELPSGTGFDDAKLVAAPSDFLPVGGQALTTSSSGGNSYGYDANGDFFMEFIIPGAQGVSGTPVPGVYALYLQGAIRTDYTLEIVSSDGVRQQPSRQTQNLVIETRGGVIDWLQSGRGVSTSLNAFDAGTLGFAGQINGQDIDTYIINNLIANLNTLFTTANVDIRISTSPIAFEGQDYSTVFLAGNAEPSAFFNDGTFGASQHSDGFNADKNDQAVVFVPSLNTLVGEPTQAGVDALVRSLTASVGRRVGELTGLRLTANINSASSPVPITATDSVGFGPTLSGVYQFSGIDRRIASQFDRPTVTTGNNIFQIFFAAATTVIDTNFFLGVQNDTAVLRTFLSSRP